MDDIAKADADEYIGNIVEKQKTIFPKADSNIKAAQEKHKEQYARRKGIVKYNFNIGDKVLRCNMQQKTKKGKKMEDRWLGPYVIIELSNTSCLLKNHSGKILKQRINLCQLKSYFEPTANSDEEESVVSENDTCELEQDVEGKQFWCSCMHLYM